MSIATTIKQEKANVGSFWGRLNSTDVARLGKITEMATGLDELSEISTDINSLRDKRHVVCRNLKIDFQPGHVWVVQNGLHLYQQTGDGLRLTEIMRDYTGWILNNSQVTPDLSGLSGLQGSYIIPTDKGFYPTVLRSLHGDLVVGVDFWNAEGFMAFRENPSNLFTNNITVISAVRTSDHPLRFSSEVSEMTDHPWPVIHYRRQSQSSKAFGAACAASAGLWVVPESDFVIGRTNLPDRVRYRFVSEGIVDVRQPHKQWNPGSPVKKGDGALRVLNLWEVLPGNGKLLLDSMVSARIFARPGYQIKVVVNPPDVGWEGESADVQLWNERQKTLEGLSEFLQIDPSVGEFWVDPVKLLESYYGASASVLDLRDLSESQISAALAFATDNKPLTAVWAYLVSEPLGELPFQEVSPLLTFEGGVLVLDGATLTVDT